MVTRSIAAALLIVSTVSCDIFQPERPEIPFAPLTDDSVRDPDNPTKVFRVDFAKVEYEHPLSREDRMKLTIENLKTFNQEELDQIYGRLTAGPIPDGGFQGDLIFPRGDSGELRLAEILGGIAGRIKDKKAKKLEKIASKLWRGKVFDRDKRVLRNYIEDLTVLKPIIDNPGALRKTEIDRPGFWGRLLPTTEVWELFPAKLYCGQSLVDARRESVIIDYLYTDEIEGYQDGPDKLAGRFRLKIRDEIRMIRPGLYLGRAYTNRLFLVNFFLYNEELDKAGIDAFVAGNPVEEDCWGGEQGLQIVGQ